MQTAQENSSGSGLVLVSGAARSGTTMLDLMLGNSDAAFSCGEVYALFRPFRMHHFEPLCTCGDPQCAVWKELRQVPECEFHARALEQEGVRYVIDSSKDLSWVLDSNGWATERNIHVHNVLIWKDPVDLAHSHWKRGRPVGYFRKQFLDYYERFLDLGLPFVAVSYKTLVEQPATMLRKLCSELGMAYSEGQEEFWNKSHHHFFGSAGTARQVGQGKSRVGLRRDFPQEFVAAYEEYTRRTAPDMRLQSVVSRLEAMDLSRGDRPAILPVADRGMRPAWYYRHKLKAIIRRRFPERTAVAD